MQRLLLMRPQCWQALYVIDDQACDELGEGDAVTRAGGGLDRKNLISQHIAHEVYFAAGATPGSAFGTGSEVTFTQVL